MESPFFFSADMPGTAVVVWACAHIAVAVVVWYLWRKACARRWSSGKLRMKASWMSRQNGSGSQRQRVSVPRGRTIALAFVNSKSGGQLGGDDLMKHLKQALTNTQVVDLAATDPVTALSMFQHNAQDSIRILCCGGDGTVGWVLTACRELKLTFPVGILPLGTGNDLSRSLEWGVGFNALDRHVVLRYLRALAKSEVQLFDQWRLEVRSHAGATPSKVVTMNNYFSMGVDAEITMNFHQERIRHPERFTSQGKNVLKYAMLGFEASFEGVALGEGVHIRDATTGHSIDVNDHWKGIIIGNVPYYQGGKRFWGDHTECDKQRDSALPFFKRCVQDGLLEVMAVSGTLHIGMVHLSVDKAIPLAQASGLEMEIKEDITMQVDGEPWRQHGPCVVNIQYLGQYPMLRPHSAL